MVPAGEMATFNCTGVGSYIRISWRLNNTLTCNNESCDPNLMAYSQEISVNSKSTNLTIDSTLMVFTDQLGLHHSQDVTFIVECRVEQNDA